MNIMKERVKEVQNTGLKKSDEKDGVTAVQLPECLDLSFLEGNMPDRGPATGTRVGNVPSTGV